MHVCFAKIDRSMPQDVGIIRRSAVVFISVAVAFTMALFGFVPGSAEAHDDGEILLHWRGDLDFGQLIPLTPGAVRVAPSAACQRVIEYGDFIESGSCTAGTFLVAGEAHRAYSVTLPVDSVQMPRFGDWWGGGPGPTASAFTLASANAFVLDPDGEDTLLVGGTLYIDPDHGDELYFGVLEVVVEYE